MNHQQTVLLNALKSGRRLTFLEAATDPALGIAALSQRCGELRNIYGEPIESEWVTTATGKRIKQYFYAGQLALVAA